MSGVEHILAIAALLLVMLPMTGAGLREEGRAAKAEPSQGVGEVVVGDKGEPDVLDQPRQGRANGLQHRRRCCRRLLIL